MTGEVILLWGATSTSILPLAMLIMFSIVFYLRERESQCKFWLEKKCSLTFMRLFYFLTKEVKWA